MGTAMQFPLPCLMLFRGIDARYGINKIYHMLLGEVMGPANLFDFRFKMTFRGIDISMMVSV